MARSDEEATVEAIHGRIGELRRELTRVAAGEPRVWSLDGTTFQFDVVREAPLLVGGYVRITTRDGRELLGQVTSSTPVEREGPRLTVDLAGAGAALPAGSTATVRLPVRATAGSGPILGLLDEDRLEPAPRTGFDGAAIVEASADAVAAAVGSGTVGLGMTLTEPRAPVALDAAGFGRHTFVCGQSGSGKTFALGKILEQLLLRTSLPLVVLDPNSDYVTITSPRAQDQTGLDDAAYAEQTERLATVGEHVHVFGGEHAPLAVRFGRLHVDEQALVLGLDPEEDATAYGALVRGADAVGDDATLAELLDHLSAGDDEERALAQLTRNRGVEGWSIWAGRDRATIADQLADSWRAAVLDLGSLPSAAERSVVSAAVLGALWRRRYQRAPHLIVIDEAHNVCPAVPTTSAEAAAAGVVRAIAAEGRKYGLYLLLSTQEPHKVHPDVLSQCANLILMRTTSRAALDQLRSVFSDVPPGMLDLAPHLTLGQGVVAGRIAPHPLAFRTGDRLTRDGGRDVPADWAAPPA